MGKLASKCSQQGPYVPKEFIEFQGTGIKLAICRKIMEIHDGFMPADREEGRGATFHGYCPVE